jgi:putative oxidoreductase
MLAILRKIGNQLELYAEKIPTCILTLVARLAIFMVFWKSVQTKISGLTIFDQHFAFWNLNDSTLLLFRFEYNLPLLSPQVAAYMATFGEFFLGLMILFGLSTRFAALGLLLMTLVIQLFVYPSAWPTHLLWATGLLMLIRNGAGKPSLDSFLKAR